MQDVGFWALLKIQKYDNLDHPFHLTIELQSASLFTVYIFQ